MYRGIATSEAAVSLGMREKVTLPLIELTPPTDVRCKRNEDPGSPEAPGRAFSINPAQVDPRPLLAMEQRLVRENRAEDWSPTAATRKAQLWESLDPVFYAAVKVRYLRLQDVAHVLLAELSDLVFSIYVSWEQYAGGTPGTAATVGVLGDEKPDRDDILGRLLAKLEKIEAFIKTQRLGGAPAVLPKRNHKGLGGFRVGVGPDPRVGFNPGANKAIPKCPRCPTAGDGHKYHSWADCPLGGKNHPADSTAAYFQPVDDCTTEELHTLALCQVFQAAAGGGAAAFAAAVEQHGAPAVMSAGAASGGVDIFAYGFTTVASGTSGDDEMDVQEELRDLRHQIATVDFLGYRIGYTTIGAQEIKCKAIQELPKPEDKTGVRSILGLMNYYKGLVGEPMGPNYSEMARPLNDLLKKEVVDIKEAWGKDQDEALHRLKDALCAGRCLKPIDYSKPIYLYTGWSVHGIGAVLGQTDEQGVEQHICVVISRSLSKTERQYARLGEMLAVVWAMRTLRQCLHGVHFTLVTDHSPLTTLMEKSDLQGQHLRRAISLQEFEFTVQYQPGPKNENADVPSRYPLPNTTDETGAGLDREGDQVREAGYAERHARGFVATARKSLW
ncbi:hypothetical protein CYMTET_48718 [Cymbomonas tetramitiformis]|uniref:Reverse transcriptase RNase H-like domain-containing protein n=1 Tax=Cymbomonas tetramitiformis TaxID=36881 RepID=A0AAE0EUV1_9CHLO|nr:hypothetical protein CYMTET_48718 [Cymbomonas tetramitiformis]